MEQSLAISERLAATAPTNVMQQKDVQVTSAAGEGRAMRPRLWPSGEPQRPSEAQASRTAGQGCA
jgi:hypothetical protein